MGELIGRDPEIKLLDSTLQKNKLFIINGVGGIGKTTLAKFYFESQVNAQHSRFEQFIWIDCKGSFKESFCEQLKYSLALQSSNVEESFSEAISKINCARQSLMVIDDIDFQVDEHDLLRKIPPNWSILLTTRQSHHTIKNHELSPLEYEDCKKLFSSFFKSETDDKLLRELFSLLDYHTLMIEIIAKVCNKANYSIASIIERLSKKQLKTIPTSVASQYSQQRYSLNGYLNELFNISDFLGKQELPILKMFSLLPPEDINLNLILHIFDIVKDCHGYHVFCEHLNNLKDLGWISKTNSGYQCHKIIKEFLFYELHISFDEIEKVIRKIEELITPSTLKGMILPFHVRCAEYLVERANDHLSSAYLCMKIADFYINYLYSHKQAEEFCDKSLQIFTKLLQPNDYRFKILHYELSKAYCNNNKCDKADQCINKAFEFNKIELQQIQELKANQIHSPVQEYDALLFEANILHQKALISYKRGLEKYDKSYFLETITKCNEVLSITSQFLNLKLTEKNPCTDTELISLALIENARENCSECIPRINANNAETYYLIALANYELENFDKAFEYAEKGYLLIDSTVQNNPLEWGRNNRRYAELLYKLGMLEDALKHTFAAIHCFRDVFKPDHPEFHITYSLLNELHDQLLTS